MTFMIVGMRKSVPYVVKAVPEIQIQGKWIADEIDSVITSIHESGFQVRAVVADDHATNVNAYHRLMDSYGPEGKPNTIIHPSRNTCIIYLFYDAVHLIKNIRNNLLNARRFIFPPFKFDKFYDNIDVPGGEIRWKLLHDVHDCDQKLPANLRKAPQLTYKTLHPGNNKQNVPLALNVFHRSTAIAITEYFPECKDATGFLNLIDTWFLISNSKQENNTSNRLGNAAIKGDMKPEFLRKFADWVEEWQELQGSNSQKFTLTAQTSDALVTTLRCTASLIEDLLKEGYKYVLTARFQSDPLELRFSRVRQMSGGRFLVGLTEFNCATRVLGVVSMLKESIDFWKEDLRPDVDTAAAISSFDSELDKIATDIETCTLTSKSTEVCAVISGYSIRKVIMGRSGCKECESLAIAKEDEKMDEENNYLNRLSRGGLIIPTADLRHHMSKSFAILDLCHQEIIKSNLSERTAAEIALKRNNSPVTFLCSYHTNMLKFINRTVVNVYFNNERKKMKDKVRKDAVKDFKQRQTKKRKT